MKKSILPILLIFLLIPAILCAAVTPQVYIVKKGDTLWGISKRFIKDPNYWPELWSNNPAIPNPHLIFPGQILNIYEDRIEVATPTPPQEIPIQNSVIIVPPPEEPVVTKNIKVPAGKEGFVSLDDLEKVGTIVDALDSRIMIGERDRVFVKIERNKEVMVGDLFLVYQYGEQVDHPVTKLPAGTRIIELGLIEIEELHSDVVTGRIVDAFQEIERGALLRPLVEYTREIVATDSKVNITATIIDALSGQMTIGQRDIVYLDAGENKGLKSGDNLYLYRKRTATDLAIGREIILPDVRLGSATIIKTYPRTATAIITVSQEPIYRGDPASTQPH